MIPNTHNPTFDAAQLAEHLDRAACAEARARGFDIHRSAPDALLWLGATVARGASAGDPGALDWQLDFDWRLDPLGPDFAAAPELAADVGAVAPTWLAALGRDAARRESEWTLTRRHTAFIVRGDAPGVVRVLAERYDEAMGRFLAYRYGDALVRIVNTTLSPEPRRDRGYWRMRPGILG